MGKYTRVESAPDVADYLHQRHGLGDRVLSHPLDVLRRPDDSTSATASSSVPHSVDMVLASGD